MHAGKQQLVGAGAVALVAALACSVFLEPAAAQQAESPKAQSFYSDAQLERGTAVFASRCAGCHATNLTGEKRGSARGGPPLTGDRFLSNWEGESLDGLLTRMKTLMPRDDPGGLADDVYLDLLALVMKTNGLPGGAAPLTTESVSELQIPYKNGPPATPRNFKMVAVVGCLAHADNVWTLTRSSDPTVTKDQPATTGELKNAEAVGLGSGTFQLVSVKQFKPDSSEKHRVLAKGLLYKNDSGPNRLNVTSFQPLQQSCTSN
jgi:hypothetical protein